MKVAKDVMPRDIKPGLYRIHNTDGSTMLGMIKRDDDRFSPLWIPLHGYSTSIVNLNDVEYIEMIEIQ